MIINNCLYCQNPLIYTPQPNAQGKYYNCQYKHELKCKVEYVDWSPKFVEHQYDTISVKFELDNSDNLSIYNYLNNNYCMTYFCSQALFKINENYLLNHSIEEIYKYLVRIKNLMVFL